MHPQFKTISSPDADAASDETSPRWRDFIETMKKLGVEKAAWSAHINEMRNVRADVIGRQVTHRVKNLIEPITRTGHGPPIYFIHSVLGTGTEVLDLADMLGPEHRILSVRPATELHNGIFPSSVENMAEKYAEALRRNQAPGPLVLIGRSAGVIIALHMRELLMNCDYDVHLLVAFDFAPYGTGADVGPFDFHYNYQRVRHWTRQLHSEWKNSSSYASFIMRGWREIEKRISQNWQRQPKNFDSPDREFEMPAYFTSDEREFVLKFNTVMKIYRYDQSPASKAKLRVLVFASTKEPDRSLYNVERKWQRIACAKNLELVSISGTHKDIAERPNVLLVANHLRSRLKELPADLGSGLITSRTG